MDDMFKPNKSLFNKTDNGFILNYDQSQSFLENTFGVENPTIIVKEYTISVLFLAD